MFGKSKVTQSMIDAVNSVLSEEDKKLLLEPEKSEKVATPTGTKVYGHRYGNSAKARKDQTAHDVDKLKGPKDKEMKEELKGNQEKIDANHNGKVDAQDFAILRSKKKVKEGREFTEKLLASIHEKKDVVMPEDASPAKNTDVADKSYLKDMGKKPTVKSDLKNLGRFLTGKKETNEAVESLDEVKKMDDATRNLLIHAHAYATGKIHKKMMNGGYKDKGEMAIHHAQELNHALSTLGRGEKLKEDVTEEGLDEMINEVLSKDASAGDWIHDFVHSDNPKFAGKSKAERKKMALGAYYGHHKEEAEITTDTLAGRTDGGKSNAFKSFKLKVKGDHTPEKDPGVEDPEETTSRTSIKAKDGLGDKVDDLDTKYGKPNAFKEEAVTEGKMKRLVIDKEEDAKEKEGSWSKEGPWETSQGTVTDKSGAKHTPMSRAKDLARQSFKKIKNEMLGKISN